MPESGTKVTKRTAKGHPSASKSLKSLKSFPSLPPNHSQGFIPRHGGYHELLSYQKALVVYQATLHFTERFVDRRSRTNTF